MTEQEAAILSATRGAKRGWQNLAVVALRAAGRWKRERDELLWLHAEAVWHAKADIARIISQEGEMDQLRARIGTTLQAVSVADVEDITDWQRGYRACSGTATKFLGGSESGGN